MIFTHLTLEDYEEFKNLLKDFRETDFSFQDFKTTFENIEKGDNQNIFLAKKDDKILGMITIIYEKKFIFNICTLAHIEDVCTKKEHRNKGIGKFLVLNAIEKAKEKKCYKITLDCSETNIEFYKKCGLEKRGIQMSNLI